MSDDLSSSESINAKPRLGLGLGMKFLLHCCHCPRPRYFTQEEKKSEWNGYYEELRGERFYPNKVLSQQKQQIHMEHKRCVYLMCQNVDIVPNIAW